MRKNNIPQSEFTKILDERREECGSRDSLLCPSGNCQCGRKLLREMVLEFVKENSDPEKLQFTTYILDRDLILRGKLNWRRVEDSKKAVKKHISKAKKEYVRQVGRVSVMAIGFPDFELVKGHPLHPDKYVWHLHWHLIVWAGDPDRFSDILAEVIRKEESLERPVESKLVFDLEGLIAYCLKFIHEMKRADRSVSNDRYPDQKLRPAELQELKEFVADTNLAKWMLLVGIDRAGYTLTPISHGKPSK